MKNQVVGVVTLMLFFFLVTSSHAQTTAFTYQGSLKDGVNPANGNYDFEFKLFDLESGGAQQGSTLQRLNVAVANGIFTVSLDFGPGTLPGADRFLDVGVRTAGGGAFTALSPRQKVNSAPYSVKSLNSTTADVATNATQLGGVAAGQYVVTTDPRMTDSRTPTAGSTNYIQNQNASAQSSSNFNISGNGTANIFSATTQFNLNGNRVLSAAGNSNLFVGVGAGTNNTGILNAFVGAGAGSVNTSGVTNSFFGTSAGGANTSGGGNSFFGTSSGAANQTGTNNAFFGVASGTANTANFNAFFGSGAGQFNTSGGANSFFGASAGTANTTGASNTAIGSNANFVSNNLQYATAIGTDPTVSTSNTIALGRGNGSDKIIIPGQVGIGTTDPSNIKLLVEGGGTYAIFGRSSFADAVTGIADSGAVGVRGTSISGTGVQGSSTNGTGVYGTSTTGAAGFFSGPVNITGKVGIGTTTPDAMLQVVAPGNQDGIHGSSGSVGYGVYGTSPDGSGVYGSSSASGEGVRGLSNTGSGVEGISTSGIGVAGSSTNSSGVYGQSSVSSLTAAGVYGRGTASGSIGVIGESNSGTGTGVYGVSTSATGYGVIGRNLSGGYAGYFDGNLLAGAFLDINQYAAGGSISVCRNGGRLAACSSSLRYKTNIAGFSQGMSFVNKLRPISFDWKDGGMKDIGFGAEDIAKIDPRFVTYNDKGEVEGVKYDRLSVAFVNAFKEQQAQIEKQQTLIEKQQAAIEQLEKRLEQLEKKENK